jgi:aspartate kinase
MKTKAVLKFGGTSLGTGERLIQVAQIVKGVTESFLPVVVVSAMSGETKSLGTTSRYDFEDARSNLFC